MPPILGCLSLYKISWYTRYSGANRVIHSLTESQHLCTASQHLPSASQDLSSVSRSVSCVSSFPSASQRSIHYNLNRFWTFTHWWNFVLNTVTICKVCRCSSLVYDSLVHDTPINDSWFTVVLCIVVRCTVVRCSVVRCTVVRRAVVRCAVVRCTVVRCTVVRCTVVRYVNLVQLFSIIKGSTIKLIYHDLLPPSLREERVTSAWLLPPSLREEKATSTWLLPSSWRGSHVKSDSPNRHPIVNSDNHPIFTP